MKQHEHVCTHLLPILSGNIICEFVVTSVVHWNAAQERETTLAGVIIIGLDQH